jgi:dihydropteroate synthase
VDRSNFPSRGLFTVPLPNGSVLHLGARCLVMGILNVTPDSFGETASRLDPRRAVDAALDMEAHGADLIDVGGESTRPGADPLSADDELARVLPVLERLAVQSHVPISIDTYKAAVARAALDAGASLVNDVSGLQYDPALARVAADRGAGLVLMHTRGRPKAMYAEAVYDDVVSEVVEELKASIATAVEAGVQPDRIVVDPGIGFAKRKEHSYGVLARLAELAAGLGRPVLIGPSRKSFMRDALDRRSASERDWGTAAAVTAAVLAGAHIVRVHAVEEMVQVVRVAEEIRKYGQGLVANG